MAAQFVAGLNALLWGLCGAVLIGASDCIARVTAQRVSISILFLAIMGMSFAMLTLWLAMTLNWPPWHPVAWGASAVSGLLNLVALYFLYQALARGPVAVASPAASTFTVWLVVMNLLVGEPWSWLQIAAMITVLSGVVMLAQPTSADSDNKHYNAQWLRHTAGYGLAAAVAVAVRMFLAQEASAELGALHGLYLNRVFALAGAIVLVLISIARHQDLQWPSGSLGVLVGLQAVLETAALGAFLIGSTGDGRVAASIGFSVFAALTALFAWWWLGERIGWQRGWWMLVVGAGVFLAMI